MTAPKAWQLFITVRDDSFDAPVVARPSAASAVEAGLVAGLLALYRLGRYLNRDQVASRSITPPPS